MDLIYKIVKFPTSIISFFTRLIYPIFLRFIVHIVLSQPTKIPGFVALYPFIHRSQTKSSGKIDGNNEYPVIETLFGGCNQSQNKCRMFFALSKLAETAKLCFDSHSKLELWLCFANSKSPFRTRNCSRFRPPHSSSLCPMLI